MNAGEISIADCMRLNAAQRDRIAELEAALKPFAEFGAAIPPDFWPDDDTQLCGFVVNDGRERYRITAGDCRRAARVMEDK